MKLNKSFLIGLIVVVIIFIVIFYILNSNKDTDDNNVVSEDNNNVVPEDNNNVVSEDKVDHLERSLKSAGIKTIETFNDTSTGYTRKELTEMIDLYYSKSKCLLEKGFTDGLTNDSNQIIKFAENSEGKVVVVIDGTSILLSPMMIVELFAMFSLVFSLENDNIDDWYAAFIGVISVMGGQDNMFATFDKNHKDPYSTLAIYISRPPRVRHIHVAGEGPIPVESESTWSPSTNPEDYVESISLTEHPTNSDGSKVNYIKYTARIQFDRNKEKINLLKENNFSQKLYDELLACNSN